MDFNVRTTISNVNSSAIQHNKLPDLVLDKLMDWIMDGKLHMGEKLNSEEIANQLGVSRMPIREALSNLEKKGLAESIPYIGTRLVKLNQDDVKQIYIARKALEPIVASDACKKITDEDIKRLEEIHEQYKKIVRQDVIHCKEVYMINRYYHFTIYGMSKLDRLCSMIELLWDNLSFFKLIYGQKFIGDPESRENMIKEHSDYLEALRNRDSDLIFKLLSENLDLRIHDIPYEASSYFADIEQDK
jgi:DNA-binding GntR family transcriptional regulator